MIKRVEGAFEVFVLVMGRHGQTVVTDRLPRIRIVDFPSDAMSMQGFGNFAIGMVRT